MFPEIVEALPMAVVLVNGDGRIDALNRRAVELLRVAGVSADGEAVHALISGFSQPHPNEAEPRPALTVRTPDGERVFGFQVTHLSAGGRLICFQDITRIEEAQRERNRLLQLASISEVMPSVLHELKNPLAGIALSLELLIEDSHEEPRDQLYAILSEVRRLALTLDGLGRFRHEVRSTRHHAIDLAIREAFSLLQPQAAARNLETVVHVADMPLLPFEPAAVRAVIFNLVTNAMHACREGQRIEVAARFDRDRATMHLEVNDSGAGMTHEVKARCTELFFTTKPKGSGIGLSLCAGVAEAVGGALHIESAPGQGTRVHLTFPVHAPEAAHVTH